jgi:hypothetical protein
MIAFDNFEAVAGTGDVSKDGESSQHNYNLMMQQRRSLEPV